MAYLTATRAKGHLYFKIVESYRVDGKVRHHTLYNIGPMSRLMELLPEEIRNPKGDSAPAAESDQDSEQPKIDVGPVRCRVHGPGFLLWSVAEWLEVMPLMDSIFPSGSAGSIKRSMSLLLSAIHRACKPGSMSQFTDWLSSTSLPDYLKLDPSVLTAQHLWEQMDDITAEQIRQFETAFYRRILDQFPEVQDRMKGLSSDSTNDSAYISHQGYRCTIAEVGHSREGRTGRKNFCVAAVLSPLLGVPTAEMVYEGNHHDRTALKNLCDDLRERLKDMADLKDMTFVLDGGVSEEAPGSMPGHFIAEGSMESSPELYDIPLDDYETIRVDDGEIRACRTKTGQYGKDRTCVITFSDDLKAGQTEELEKQLRKLDCEIRSLNDHLADPESLTDRRETTIRQTVDGLLLPEFHMTDFMDVSYETVTMKDPVLTGIFRKELSKDQRKSKKSGTDAGKMEPLEMEIQGLRIKSLGDIPDTKVVKSVSLSVSESKKQSMIRRYYGKHLLITDRGDWTNRQIYTAYRDQQFVKRFFRDTGETDRFPAGPSYHWTDQKIRVHVMLCCLGLALCRVAACLMDRDQSCPISAPRLMEVLTPVQECLVPLSVNGLKTASRKTICEIQGETRTAWDAALKLCESMRLNPIRKKE